MEYLEKIQPQLELIKDQWDALPSIARKVIIGFGAYVGFTSTLALLAGRYANGGFLAAYVRSKRRLDGQTALVTGANSGSGYATALELLRRGCNVIITCRSQAKAQDTVTRLKADLESCESAVGELNFLLLDLGSRRSVDQFLADFKALNMNVNILVNNAGAWLDPVRITEDGIEGQWQVNYYAPFYLTQKLLPGIIKSAQEIGFGRIVNVSSIAHGDGNLDDFNGFLDSGKRGDIEFWKNRSTITMYGSTKCAQICHVKKLQEEVNKTDAKNFVVAAAHPGWIDSGFANASSRPLAFQAVWAVCYPIFSVVAMLSWKQGAQTSLFCILDDGVKPGGYHTHCAPAPTFKSADEVIATKTDELYETSLKIWE